MDPRSVSQSFRSVTDRELLDRVETLVRRAHNATLSLILHFGEIERRRIHLTMGYRSMFDYCIRRLRFSESAANRRIRVARCVARFPEVFQLLKEMRLSMMAVSRVSGLINDDNKRYLLGAIEGKTYDEIDAIAAGMKPGVPVRERIRAVCVDRSGMQPKQISQRELSSTPNGMPSGARKPERPNQTTDAPATSMNAPRQTPAPVERHFKFEFGLREPAMRKFSRAHALLTAKFHRGVTTAEFFENLIDEWLVRNDPTLRALRREERAAQGDGEKSRRQDGVSRISRHVPAAIRDAVFRRDGGRCTYVGSGGVRCSARTGLELDHIKPFALGGGHTVDNLRLLCAAHNRLRAERSFGPRQKEAGRD